MTFRVAWTIAVLLAGCREAGEPAIVPPPELTEEEGSVDWSARTVDLSSAEWTLEFCEGDGLFLCVARDGVEIGALEKLSYPVATQDAIAEALRAGKGEVPALMAAAEDFLASIRADRARGMGDRYVFRPERPEEATVFGRPGVRVGFMGEIGGRPIEKTVQYQAIVGDSLHILSAQASSAEGLARGFTAATLAEFEPLLARIAAASRARPTPRTG